MKRILPLLFVLPILFSCKKPHPEPPPAENEEALSITIDPDSGGALEKALGSTYDFKLFINSKMPKSGVVIKVGYQLDADGSIVFSQELQTKTPPISITITNIDLNYIGTVTVDVQSKDSPSNKANKSFRLARK